MCLREILIYNMAKISGYNDDFGEFISCHNFVLKHASSIPTVADKDALCPVLIFLAYCIDIVN